jgi:predicted ATP-grasp superfamily ATP-dependent carboligase
MGQEQQEEEVLEAELVSIVGIDTVMEENSPIVVVTVAVVKYL